MLYGILLLLLGVANGAPILVTFLLKDRFAAPVDLGLTLWDGQRLFGSSKTVRGLVASVAWTGIVAELLGIGFRCGAEIGAVSMAGDLGSSFLKRRLKLPPHAQAFGLDQIPEALLPLLAVRSRFGLTGLDIGMLLAAFVVLEVCISWLLFKLHIRDRPY